jgi:hypothetical protein
MVGHPSPNSAQRSIAQACAAALSEWCCTTYRRKLGRTDDQRIRILQPTVIFTIPRDKNPSVFGIGHESSVVDRHFTDLYEQHLAFLEALSPAALLGCRR